MSKISTTERLPADAGTANNLAEVLREKILATPEVILEDQHVMRALVGANERAMGENVIDMRGMAMERLEARLDRLEDTHRSVIAAAYENLAGTNQIHRAILCLMDPVDFAGFLDVLRGELMEILRVDALALVLETEQSNGDAVVERMGDVLKITEAGFVSRYIEDGRKPGPEPRIVTLRPVEPDQDQLARLFGDRAAEIRSEACLRLDLGDGRLPGMLLMGSSDAGQFTAQHATDLLAFFGGVFERCMRRWLS